MLASLFQKKKQQSNAIIHGVVISFMSEFDKLIYSDERTKSLHDVECLSNEIKFLIPSLITKIEYNKIFVSSDILNFTDEKLKEYLEKTKSFVLHLESYCKSL